MKVIEPLHDLLAKAVDFIIYVLARKSARYDSGVASRNHLMQNNPDVQVKTHTFKGHII